MHRDAALSSGNPHLLSAVGALEVAVFLVLHPGAAGFKTSADRPNQLKKSGVFRPPAVDVAGEHPKEGDEQQHQHDEI